MADEKTDEDDGVPQQYRETPEQAAQNRRSTAIYSALELLKLNPGRTADDSNVTRLIANATAIEAYLAGTGAAPAK